MQGGTDGKSPEFQIPESRFIKHDEYMKRI